MVSTLDLRLANALSKARWSLICAVVTNGLVLCSPSLNSFGNEDEDGAFGTVLMIVETVEAVVTSGVGPIARKSGLFSCLYQLYNYL
jgi:hypothetical protein